MVWKWKEKDLKFLTKKKIMKLNKKKGKKKKNESEMKWRIEMKSVAATRIIAYTI